MKRTYNIEWYPIKDAKYGDPLIRHTIVNLSTPTGKTADDAKNALNLFIRQNGNLHKNNIVKIKEFDEKGQIGKDIVPSDEEDAIIPISKK